jgi:hypothetical protein
MPTSRANALPTHLDDDAYLDALVGGSVMRGNGDGTFTLLQGIPYMGSGPTFAALGNLNADDRPDLVLIDPSTTTIMVLD